MQKREAKFQAIFSKYVQDQNKKGKYFYYELKQTQSNCFSFGAFEPQQLPSLQALEKSGWVGKLSDADPRIKPCDGMSTPPHPAYVVIAYPKAFVMIRVNNFILARNSTVRKTLTYDRALGIAEKIIHM
jgi:hypothetical protein